ncbi:unnamed protein product [Medioppia subpectinata]|uniref:GH16 domain-containing protein n=1 Tax=Medioppia subpectinata TaxID=1979941 RepID=A0A7R9PVK9_9ACAR|nr:unnamed protein product [Medioppia subpectinata]CAG2102750.1 unnamed protein product [Medioppia subpectinata]
MAVMYIKMLFPMLLLLMGMCGPASGDWVEVWRDDFNGNSLNLSNWKFETGGGGWGNNELEYYTNGQNADVCNGSLTITAKVENVGCENFTSSRLNSIPSWTYGYFQARAKLPKGKDLWPAIWLFPQNNTYGLWAASGEIDIMEYKGQVVDTIEGTIWYGAKSPNEVFMGSGHKSFPIDFSADYHVFGMQWTNTFISWLLDGQQYYSVSINGNLSSGAPYTANGQPFDQPFNWVLNVAVGGNYFPVSCYGPVVTPALASQWPQPYMQIDYVSVSQWQTSDADIVSNENVDTGKGGHMYSAIGIAETLIASGHEVWFTVNSCWSGQLTRYGINEVLLDQMDSPLGTSIEHTVKGMKTREVLSGASPAQKARYCGLNFEFIATNVKLLDKQLERPILTIKPDVIVLDQMLTVPSVELSGIPCVWVCSHGPLYLMAGLDERAPPFASGLSATGDQSLWREFRQIVRNSIKEDWMAFNDYMIDRGCKPLPKYAMYNPLHYLNIYGYPLELDYQDIRPLSANFIRFDNLMRTESDLTFVVPRELVNKPGKFIYFSLGHFGSADLGPLNTEYTLADNMWGQEWVSQIQVIRHIDLVITHGGNNSVCETMFFGKPMIVMPLFADQYDNAQRIHDKGFGLRLDAYKCSEEELLAAIETLLSDSAMTDCLAEVSRRIQTDNSLAKLPKLIEDFVQNPDKYINTV